ncbi:MAG: glycerol-3-phosphate dehydrogenase [Chloroflexota bacterium]|nr:glycerol-3-phosphate dehydrogenase [Chloroflexota bacterium]
MWQKGWRETVWSGLDKEWDVLVIGGGITGAGVARLAAAHGLETLLVEARDFAFGTSSRSSKLAHGGFRYLYNRQFDVTFESVRQREELLREAPNLVTPLAFNLPNYRSYGIPSYLLHMGVCIYDAMAPKWRHSRLSAAQLQRTFPQLRTENLETCFRYEDAELDDARLVLRVIREAVANGASALNYTRAESLLRDAHGHVCGAVLRDEAAPKGRTAEVRARVVVNASGPWTDVLRAQLDEPARLRKLRGSHLIFDAARLPIPEALTIFHPVDKRAMFALPWEGKTLVGTTDVDHGAELESTYDEPFAAQSEIDYILTALDFLFPSLKISQADVISSFAGLRPIIRGDADSPSQESRAHQIWNEHGLITITGGKLTTFRLMARQTLSVVLAALGRSPRVDRHARVLEPLVPPSAAQIAPELVHFLSGRHGREADELLGQASTDELTPIADLPNPWAELRYAARNEGVVHLDDLLLRRLRLGMLLPQGGADLLPRIRTVVQPELGWDDRRWQAEEQAYRQTWQRYYSPQTGNLQS